MQKTYRITPVSVPDPVAGVRRPDVTAAFGDYHGRILATQDGAVIRVSGNLEN
jgi:hypothetical protein